MNVNTIEIDPVHASEKLRAYRSRKHKDAEKQYAAAIKLLEHAKNGHRILNVGDAIAAAPRDAKGRPMLAIARADRKEVCVTWARWPEPSYTFDCSSSSGRRTESLTKAFSRPNLPISGASRGFATVPMVPADVRPQTGQLKDWHILFEVERWHDTSIVDPPVDPLLLSHIEGDFYRIIAEWNLTEIERAAMQMALAR